MSNKQICLCIACGIVVSLLLLFANHYYIVDLCLNNDVSFLNDNDDVHLRQKLNNNNIMIPSRFAGCKMVYLDVGTNIGVQIRKLFEPSRYPSAEVTRFFDEFFGPKRNENKKDLCAIGIEMNPSHTRRLSALESHYASNCGYRVHIFTETAATVYDGSIMFFSDDDYSHEEWGASTQAVATHIHKWSNRTVRAMDLAAFILHEIMPHATTIVMKLDIEGAEHNVFPRLLAKGVLCAINLLFVETHQRMMTKEQWTVFQGLYDLYPALSAAAGCNNSTLSTVDDESYLHDVDQTMNTC